VALAAAVGGCTEAEPRSLRLRLRMDSTMPSYDHVQVSFGCYNGGTQITEDTFALVSTDFDASGAYETVLFISKHAEAVDVLAEVHLGGAVIGHGRRTVVTLENQAYDLEVEIVPHPSNEY